jgi:hypothetical protein
MNKIVIIIVVIIAISSVIGAGLLYLVFDSTESPSMKDLLDGQEATEARTVQTETGGTPHHEPIQYRAKDSRDAIVTPEFIAGSEAQIAGGTKGIGITINGESRFYPLYVMQYHQVINDTLQDTAIAASY